MRYSTILQNQVFTIKSRRKRKPGPASAFVSKSACCCSYSAATISVSPLNTNSRRKWCLTLMCFEFDAHTGLCARCFAPLVVLKNCDACRIESRQNKTPYVTQENRLLGGVYQCCVLGLYGRKRHALLGPRKPANACSCAHDSPTGSRPPISGCAGVVSIHIRNQLQSTAPLKSNVRITGEKTYSKVPPAVFQCTSPGEFVYLATAFTGFSTHGRVSLANHIKHPTSSRKDQSPSG